MTQISLPSAITVRRYRCFVEPTRLELRPITLLFGVNNSGKSALLRLLPLLAEGTLSSPLNLESPAARGASFQDLQSRLIEGPDAERDLGICLEWANKGMLSSLDASLHFMEAWNRVLVRQLRLKQDTEEIQLNWRFVESEQHSEALSYTWLSGGTKTQVRVKFDGLMLPHFIGAPALLEGMKSSPVLQASLLNRVQWLAATRQLPLHRVLRRPSGPRWQLESSGIDSGDALAANPDVLKEVSSWYEKVLGLALKIRDLPGGYYKVVFEHRRKASFEVDIADGGEGLAQLLPILTARSLGRRSGQFGQRILAIEEPESHLHPELQMLLAEYFCQRTAEQSEPYLVLETHSQHMLLGVQLQVVLGRLDPEKVVIYWVRQTEDGSSVIDRIGLDAMGRPTGDALPPGVFKEDLKVSRLIVEERLRREGIEF